MVTTKNLVKLVWAVNQSLGLKLQRGEDYSYKNKKGEEDFWPLFQQHIDETETTVSLIRNRGLHSLLVPELKNVDVFLVESQSDLTFQLSLEKVSKTGVSDFCFQLNDSMASAESMAKLNLE